MRKFVSRTGTVMLSSDPVPILRELLAGHIDPPEAARRLLALNGPAAMGLGHAPGVLSESETARLPSLMPAVQWEMAKQLSRGVLPDVTFGSPEYHAFLRGGPRGPEPAG